LSFERITRLGTELAAELADTDTLGRWMSHYISDLIVRAENAESSDRDLLEQQCAREILSLWAHRAGLPSRPTPLKSFAPLYRALERLDPEGDSWGFYNTFDDHSKPDEAEASVNVMLKLAMALEENIGDVVRLLILEAASVATDGEAKWLALAEGLDDDESLFRKQMWKLTRKFDDEQPDLSREELRKAAAIDLLDRTIASCNAAKTALGSEQN